MISTAVAWWKPLSDDAGHFMFGSPSQCAPLEVRVDDGYNKVFKENLENLGLLESKVVTRTVEQAVVSDVISDGLIAEGKGWVTFPRNS
ncbi:MAG: hypothetical protein EKK46_13440 [Rhodocyclaceae bacterium]|nr:MAG: hypothetical protein EKK46_13440 [Rhodocyclaceae bacterium]